MLRAHTDVNSIKVEGQKDLNRNWVNWITNHLVLLVKSGYTVLQIKVRRYLKQEIKTEIDCKAPSIACTSWAWAFLCYKKLKTLKTLCCMLNFKSLSLSLNPFMSLKMDKSLWWNKPTFTWRPCSAFLFFCCCLLGFLEDVIWLMANRICCHHVFIRSSCQKGQTPDWLFFSSGIPYLSSGVCLAMTSFLFGTPPFLGLLSPFQCPQTCLLWFIWSQPKSDIVSPTKIPGMLSCSLQQVPVQWWLSRLEELASKALG